MADTTTSTTSRMAENQRKLWAVVRREYLSRVRTRWFVISTVFGPLLFSLFAFLPLILSRRDASQTAHRVIVLDATNTSLGRYVARSLGAQDGAERQATTVADVQTVTPAELEAARATATSDVTRRLASGVVVLDATTLRGDSVRYAGRQADSRSEMRRISDAVRAGLIAVRLEQHGVPAATVDTAIAVPAPVLATETINDAGKNTASEAKAILAAGVSFLLYMSIVLYGQSMLSGVIEEKLSRVAEIVISSVSPDILLAGKVLGVTAVGITQQVAWIAGSVLMVVGRGYLFGAPAAPAAAAAGNSLSSGAFLDAAIATPWSWVLVVLLFFLLGFIFYGALYAAVGATVGSEQEARQAAQPVIMLLVLTAVFISPVLQNPGSDIARVMSLLPFSSAIIMPLRMAMVDVPAWEVTTSIVLLLLGCFAAVWLAARIYRVGLLMYGKRPSLRELRRWIAAA